MANEQPLNSEPFKISGNWFNQVHLLHVKFNKFAQQAATNLKLAEGKDELLGRIQAGIHKERVEVINLLKNKKISKNPI